MPSLGSTMRWKLELDNDELLLVLKALGGRLEKDHAREAVELGNRITHLRVARLKAIAANTLHLERALSEAEEGKTDDQAV